MAVAVPALLLAASLLQPGDAAGARALFGRLARRPTGAVRRLSGDTGENATFLDECKAACPELAAMEAATIALEQQDQDPMEPWASVLSFINVFCDYESTAQCFLNAQECSSSDAFGTFEMFTPMLACICDTCSGAKLAWAKLISMGFSGDDNGSQDGQGDRRLAGTTTEGLTEAERRMMVETTEMAEVTTTGAATTTAMGMTFTLPDVEWPDMNMSFNFTDDLKEAMCLSYSLGVCVEDYPDECAILDDMMNITTMMQGTIGEMVEGWCTGDGEFAPDGDDDDDDDDSDGGDVVGRCGPVGLGWLAASVPLAMAALQFMAA